MEESYNLLDFVLKSQEHLPSQQPCQQLQQDNQTNRIGGSDTAITQAYCIEQRLLRNLQRLIIPEQHIQDDLVVIHKLVETAA